jgi:RNase P subunit RPR2
MTTRIQLAHGQMVRVFCAECGHEMRLDLEDIIARGLGDHPLQELRYRCRATRMAPDAPGLFSCGGTQVRCIIQPEWRERPR